LQRFVNSSLFFKKSLTSELKRLIKILSKTKRIRQNSKLGFLNYKRKGVKMKQKHIISLVTLVIGLFIFVLGIPNTALCQNGNGNYQITIYVDEGRGQRNGHVFFGLTAGQTTVYAGWHSVNKALAPLALGGGEVRNDKSLINSCKWDVKKTYNITQSDYQRALQVMNKWDTDGRAWAITHHCGDFAEAVALAAGVPIQLPKVPFDIDTRPGLFGEYLRDRQGEIGAETFYVHSYVNTRTVVKRGDKISIKASGKVKFGSWVGWGGPEGIVGVSDSYNFFDNILHGSLIGRIKTANAGNWDDWGYIGKGAETISEVSGVLELNVNDNEPENNEGNFEVEIRVCSSQ
jgi:hypothetical protein